MKENNNREQEKPYYGNWVPKKIIKIGFFVGFISLILAYFIPIPYLQVGIGGFGIFSLAGTFYMVYAFFMFSPKGGNIQEKIHDLIAYKLPWDGDGICLDIGCGNAPVSIRVAKKYPNAKIIASDYWGETHFEYTEKECSQNAKIEGVIDRFEFKHANAAKLPFDDNSFDAVVSNLVFHEVNDFKSGEKHKSIIEALRVLKKGGVFAFQDLFTWKMVYGDFEILKKNIQKEVTELHWIDTVQELNIPKLLRNPMFLGDIGLFYGIK
ncbi:MAG: class I SAM-dependent methyltransferase [archaeon]|nr:class I SAM-dependent methyltransferase [archaeon]